VRLAAVVFVLSGFAMLSPRTSSILPGLTIAVIYYAFLSRPPYAMHGIHEFAIYTTGALNDSGRRASNRDRR
jgi:hypothetical protein